jgi:hypothetical protein
MNSYKSCIKPIADKYDLPYTFVSKIYNDLNFIHKLEKAESLEEIKKILISKFSCENYFNNYDLEQNIIKDLKEFIEK